MPLFYINSSYVEILERLFSEVASLIAMQELTPLLLLLLSAAHCVLGKAYLEILQRKTTCRLHRMSQLKYGGNLELKGTVQRDLRGVKSGINR